MALPERWQQIEDLYHAAVTLAPADRAPLLDAADPEIRREVESLLRQDGSTETMIGGLGGTPNPAARSEPRQVGPYMIEGSLGAGGMGEVVRASDTRLGRAVAIKFCDPRFIERFAREAKAISALNHPNICTLYDVGPNYLVMELIEGQTLAARIRQGPLAFDEVLQYGAQIAGALAEAHAAGIVHRDLKPGNVMISKHGVKVLDFGLAKLNSSTEDGLTRTNAVMGTPAYMAPEQVKGKPADARADLFALGLIIHEMAAGKLPFPGVSLGTMLASDDSTTLPPPSKARAGFPTKLDRLVAHLLSANPAGRPASAASVRDQLLAIGAPKSKSNGTALAAAAILALAIGAAGWWFINTKPAPLEVASLRQIAAFPGDKLDPAFSPDGTTIAFSWHGEKGDAPGIYLMPASSGQPHRLTRSATEDVSPAWDASGKRIAFLRLHPGQASEAIVVSVDNGVEQRVRDVNMPEYLRRERPVLAWTLDGAALAMPMDDLESGGASLFRVALEGRTQLRLVGAKAGLGVTSPAFSPDGKWLAYQQSDPPRLYAQRLNTDGSPQGEPQIVVDNSRGASPVWAPDGRELWFLSGPRIMAWDSATGASQIVYTSPSTIQGMAASWASGGTAPKVPQVVFSTSGAQAEVHSLELSEGGRKSIGQPSLVLPNAFDPSLSLDGRWIAFASDVTGNEEIWIATANGEHRRQLTHGGFVTGSEAQFSSDLKHISFHARKPTTAQIYVIDVDVEAEMAKPDTVPSNPPVRQITNNAFSLMGPMWSADGKYFYALAAKGYRMVRLPSSGGEVEDLFEANGFMIGRTRTRMYYGKPDRAGLYVRSLEGDVRSNPEQRLTSDYVGLQQPDPTERGVYYQGSDANGKWVAIRFFDFALGKSFDIAPPSRDFLPHIMASPDGRRLFYSTISDAPGSLTLLQLRRVAN